VAPTTSSTNRTDDHNWPSYDWSADYQRARSHYPDYLSREDSFASPPASETSTAMRTSGSGEYSLEELGAHRLQTVPPNYWETNRSGASTSTSYVVGVRL